LVVQGRAVPFGSPAVHGFAKFARHRSIAAPIERENPALDVAMKSRMGRRQWRITLR
jgi:hypothetical protein